MKKSTFSCNPSINKGLYLKKSFAQGGGHFPYSNDLPKKINSN